MVCRVAAGIVAAMFALAAPAVAQVKVDRKPDQAEAMRKTEAEVARLKAMQAELEAELKRLRMELDREAKIERIEKNQIELKLAGLKREAQAELDRAFRLKDEQLKRAEVEFDRATRIKESPRKLAEEIEKVQRNSKLQDERARLAQKEFDRLIELQTGQDKPKVVTLEVELKDQDKPKVLVFSSGDKQPVPYEKMSPQELKQVIVKLQTLLDEKMRNAEKPSGVKVKPAYPGKPLGEKVKPLGEKVKPGSVSQDEILKRLDKLSYEIEDIKRSIKK